MIDHMRASRESARRNNLKELKKFKKRASARTLCRRSWPNKKPTIAPWLQTGRSPPTAPMPNAAPVRRRPWAVQLQPQRDTSRFVGSQPLSAVMACKFDVMMSAITAEETGFEHGQTASEFALAQIEILRIRSVRAAMMAKIDVERLDSSALKRLRALDRYERYALTRHARIRNFGTARRTKLRG